MACTHPEIESTEMDRRYNSSSSNHSILSPHSIPDQNTMMQSSSSTIFGIMNTLSGSPILLLPVLFKTCGIFTCMIILIIIGKIQFLTCTLYLDHQKENERRLERTIRRILGQNWLKIYNISSGVFMFIVGVIYYQLINISLYFLITSIMVWNEYENFNQDNSVNFSQYSLQIQALILIIPLSLLIIKKDISQIIGLSKYGVISLFAYVCYLIYLFIDKVFYDPKFEQQKVEILWFSNKFSEPAGNFALGFMVHNCIGMLVENQPNKHNNIKLTGISYLLVVIIYCFIGILGSIGLLGMQPLAEGHTIMEYFSHQSIPANLINILILIKLISVYPLVHYFSKNQILNTFYPNKDYSDQIILSFSASFILGSVIISLLNIRVDIVIGIDGAIVGFLIIYIIPIMMHFQCYYGRKKAKILNGQQVSCVNHKKDNRFSLIKRVSIYSAILLIGLYNMSLQIYQI